MTRYQENFFYTTSFIKRLLKNKMVTLLLGHPVFAEIWSTESKRKIKNDDVCLRRDSNQRPLAIQRDTLTTFYSKLVI